LPSRPLGRWRQRGHCCAGCWSPLPPDTRPPPSAPGGSRVPAVQRWLVSGCVACLLTVLGLPALATAQVQPYGTNDYGNFNNVLPPGENGFDNIVQLGQFETSKTYPPHASDQRKMYSSLTTAAPSIQASQI